MESLIKDLLRYNKTPCSASRPRSLAAVEGCSSACVWLLLRSCGITRRSSVNRVARFRTLRTQGLSWTRGQKAGALLPQRHGQVDNRNRVRRSPYSILSRSSCVVRMACTPSFLEHVSTGCSGICLSTVEEAEMLCTQEKSFQRWVWRCRCCLRCESRSGGQDSDQGLSV